MTAASLRVGILAVLGAVTAIGCAGHRAQVRGFETGRETPFFREQVARASVPSAPGPGPLASVGDREPGLGDLKDRWVRRVEERDDFEGLLDLSVPDLKAAFAAGKEAPATESLLTGSPVPLATVRALVASRSPRVRAAREAWRATVEQLEQAEWLDQVTSSLRAFARDLDTRVGGEGPAASRTMVKEYYPWPAAAALRGEMANLEAAMAREKARMELATALADAEDAFAAAWESGERARVLEGFLPILRNMAEVAASRYATGRGTQDEALRVETEIRKMESDLATAREQRVEGAARLNALLDRAPGAAFHSFAQPGTATAPPDADQVIAASSSSPEVAMAERSEEMARVVVRMAEIMAHPLPATAAAPDRGPAFGPLPGGPGGDAMGMGGAKQGGAGAAPGAMASETAPPWYGVEEAYVRELRRRASAAESSRDAARRDAEAMAREAWRMLDTAIRELRVAEGTTVPLAGQAFDVSRRDYQTGTATFADHLESWGTVVGAKLEALSARRMALEARAAVLRATAREFGE